MPGGSTSAGAAFGRREASEEIGALGRRIAVDPAFSVPDVPPPEGLRLEFLGRVVVPETGHRVDNATFNRRFREAWPAHDELHSTAMTRHFVSGLLEGNTPDNMASDLWTQWGRAVDLLSMLRIPTRSSGFSTATGLMQHPTATGEGLFSEKSVAGHHSTLDTARVVHIGKSVKAASEAGMTASQQFLAASRAAIDFTLNYFTAPITAATVQQYSTQAEADPFDPTLQAALAARERLKDLYRTLGGALRDSIAGETASESLLRPWQQGIPITEEEPFPFAPPSPLREGVGGNAAPEVLSEPEALPEPGLQEPIAEAEPFLAAPPAVQEPAGTPQKRDRPGEEPAAQGTTKAQRTAARSSDVQDDFLSYDQLDALRGDISETDDSQDNSEYDSLADDDEEEEEGVYSGSDLDESDFENPLLTDDLTADSAANVDSIEWPVVPTDAPGAAEPAGDGANAFAEWPNVPTNVPGEAEPAGDDVSDLLVAL